MKPTQHTNTLTTALACIAIPAAILASAARAADADPAAKWENDIQAFEQWDAKNAWPKDPVLFAGSSSIRMWKTHDAFPNRPVLNRGFGGSQISDVNYYLDRIVLKYKPRVIAFYCGDNDIAAGKTPERVLADYKAFVARVHKALPDTHIIFLTIKPSGARWNLWEEMSQANTLIRDFSRTSPRLHYANLADCLLKDGRPDDTLFLQDRLHLNDAGYDRWNQQLRPILRNVLQTTRKEQNPGPNT